MHMREMDRRLYEQRMELERYQQQQQAQLQAQYNQMPLQPRGVSSPNPSQALDWREIERVERMKRDWRCQDFYHRYGRWPVEGEAFDGLYFHSRDQLQQPIMCYPEAGGEQYGPDENAPVDPRHKNRRKLFWARYKKNNLIKVLVKA